ncbi:MAG: right-handed parallel beta-helix repeat-containing protein [Gaiellaceae bacterium]
MPAASGLASTNADATFGRQAPGSDWYTMSADYKRSSRFTFDGTGMLTDLVAYLDGLGRDTGSQQVRFAIYADDAGEPGALLGQTSIGAIVAGSAASWVDLPLLTPVPLTPGAYHLAVLSGPVGGIARYSREPAAGGLRYTDDLFVDGAAPLYGPSDSDDYEAAIYGVVASPPAITCTRTIDGGSITAAANALTAGTTLCLSGQFTEDVSVTVPGITITSADAANRAAVAGYFEIHEGADGVTISGLRIDSSDAGQGNQVYARDVRFTNNDISGATVNCLFVGSRVYGAAERPLIDHNRIHDCGDSRLEHGIYVDETYGGRISNNVIYAASGFGVQLYKRAVGMEIDHNVFDGNGLSGLLISGDTTSSDASGCAYSRENTIEKNIFTANGDYGVADWWGCTIGTGNDVAFNCWYGNADGGHDFATGYTEHDNLEADPLYTDPLTHDYSLRPGSPCEGMGPQLVQGEPSR